MWRRPSRHSPKVTLAALLLASAHVRRELDKEKEPLRGPGTPAPQRGTSLLALLLVLVCGMGERFNRRRRSDYLGADYISGRGDYIERPPDIGPAKLLELVYDTPTTYSKFTTAADFQSIGGAPNGTHVWHCDEAASPFVDKIAAEELAINAGDATTALHQRKMVGAFDGTDAYSVLGVERTTLTSGNGFNASSNAFFDHDETESFAFFVDFRGLVTSNTVSMVRKLSGAGFSLARNFTTGLLVFTITDGVTPASITSTLGYSDGALHRVLCVVDRSADEIRMYTEREAVTPVDCSSVGSLSVASPLEALRSVAGATSMSYSQFGLIDDTAEAEKITGLGTSWSHAQDPGGGSAIFPVLNTYTRASVACPIVGYEPGFGDRVAKYGPGQFAHVYDGDYSHASGLALLLEPAGTNICLDSEGLEAGSAWGVVATTRTANSAEAPDGTQTSTKLTADSANALTKQAITTVAETEYTQSIFIKRSAAMGGNVSGRLIQYDATGAAENAAVAFTASDEWTRIQLTATTAAGQISTEFQIEIDTSNEEVEVWGAQLETSAYATSYIPTTSSSATRVVVTAQLTNTGGVQYLNPQAGEAEAVFTLRKDTGNGSDRTVWDLRVSGTPDLIVNRISTAGAGVIQHYDGAGALVVNIAPTAPADWAAQENTLRYRWDGANDLPGHAGDHGDSFVNGTRGTADPSTWTAGTAGTKLNIGQNHSSADLMDGSLAFLRIWDGPRVDSP